jgi:polyhydroxyalkanoate synthesis regulator phasin
MRLAIGVLTILLMFSAGVFAQLSPEEAQQRMQDRIAQEKAAAGQQGIDATQPSSLTNGQVTQLYKTISQQQSEIEKLTADVQRLKDDLTTSQINLRDAQAAAAAAKNPDNAAANLPTPADINTAISQHKLVIGMTLDQCNESLGRRGWQIYSDDSGKETRKWGVPTQTVGRQVFFLPYVGDFEDGKLVHWNTEAIVILEPGDDDSVLRQ